MATIALAPIWAASSSLRANASCLARSRLVLGLGEHVDGELDDVVHLAGARAQDRLEVLADLAELGDHVAAADHVAVLVQRDLTGHVDGLPALDLPAVGVTGGLRET